MNKNMKSQQQSAETFMLMRPQLKPSTLSISIQLNQCIIVMYLSGTSLKFKKRNLIVRQI